MVDFTGILRAFQRGKHSAWLDPENIRTNTITRGLQLFFLFVSLFILIGIAVFQKKNEVGPSAWTAILFIVLVPTIIMSSLQLAVPILYDRSGSLKGIHQAISQIRFQVVVTIATCSTLLIFTIVQTFSGNTSGCKVPQNDPHAEKDGYLDKLPGFCRSKRALAAFMWFSLIAWLFSAFLVYKQWRSSRSSGIIPPFREPSSATQADHGEMDEPFSVANAPYDPPRADMAQIAQSRTSNSFYAGDRQPFDDALPTGYRPDPFRDPSPAYTDPYDRIRAELDGPPQLPPIQYSRPSA